MASFKVHSALFAVQAAHFPAGTAVSAGGAAAPTLHGPH